MYRPGRTYRRHCRSKMIIQVPVALCLGDSDMCVTSKVPFLPDEVAESALRRQHYLGDRSLECKERKSVERGNHHPRRYDQFLICCDEVISLIFSTCRCMSQVICLPPQQGNPMLPYHCSSSDSLLRCMKLDGIASCHLMMPAKVSCQNF